MTSRPGLAKHIQSFTWTLIWWDFDEHQLQEIDLQTWNVFERMSNVAYLDLGSLHEVTQETYVRQNPSTLFPAVTDLRLLGWMHRGLVKAIILSLDTRRLRSLRLDYLQDEGALPDGTPLDPDTAVEYAHSARKREGTHAFNHDTAFDDEAFYGQETGKLFIFPGPMWLPLLLLRYYSLDSLSRFQVRLANFSKETDLRNYYSLSQHAAAVILKAQGSLRTLDIAFGVHPTAYPEYRFPHQCGTSRNYQQFVYRPWCMRMAAAFLKEIIAALDLGAFPYLHQATFAGFDILEDADAAEISYAQLSDALEAIRNCALSWINFTGVLQLDYREDWLGQESATPDLSGLENVLRDS